MLFDRKMDGWLLLLFIPYTLSACVHLPAKYFRVKIGQHRLT